jgi:SNF2 family DNA or RNA helicase
VRWWESVCAYSIFARDTVLIVCPNVTIKNWLDELDPNTGEASLYHTHDLMSRISRL